MAINMFKLARRRRKQGSVSSFQSSKDASESGSSATTISRRNHFRKAPSLRSNLSVTPSSPQTSEQSNARGVSETSIGSVTASTRSSAGPKRVKFHEVKVREYERVLCNNPSCSSGAPVGLGWGYTKEKQIELDVYESNRRPRRSNVELVLTRQEREEILVEWGASFNEIVEAIRSNIRTKNQRRHTVNTLGRYDRWEEMMESAGRRLKRTILLQKPSGQQARELSAQVHTLRPHDAAPSPPARHHHHHGQTVLYEVKTSQHVYTSDPSSGGLAEESKDGVVVTSHHSQTYSLSADNLAAAAAAAGDTLPKDYTVDLNDGGDLPSKSQPPPLATGDRQNSLGSLAPSLSAPVLEIDVMEGVDVESRISYEETIMFQQSYGGMGFDSGYSQGDNDSYSSDGFGQLMRDTSHWYVDGREGGPSLHRRDNPVIISEEDFYSEQQRAQEQMQQQIVFDQQGRPYLMDQNGNAIMIDPQQIVQVDAEQILQLQQQQFFAEQQQAQMEMTHHPQQQQIYP
mmetsp:Transcript_22067/g.61329  ORF Transcript_22067/g.61329 Transcript_22067/m.61329 type:complete len:514 (-) Transcript_22067:226-1767(-)